jgi:hypothetical protein
MTRMNAGRKHVLSTFISPTIVVYITGWLRDELHNRSINGRLKVGVNKKRRQFLRLAALFFSSSVESYLLFSFGNLYSPICQPQG